MLNKLFCCENFMTGGLILLTTVILLYLLYPNVFIREHFQYEGEQIDIIKSAVALAWKEYMKKNQK